MSWLQLAEGKLQKYAEYTMWNAELNESQAGIKQLGEMPATSDTQMIPL